MKSVKLPFDFTALAIPPATELGPMWMVSPNEPSMTVRKNRKKKDGAKELYSNTKVANTG